MDNFKGNLDNLMKEAEKMQKKMQDAQNELTELKITGEAGAGLVKITLNGRHYPMSVKISETLLEDDIEMLEDLVAAAISDAVKKVEKASQGLISKLTAGMQLPTDFKMPGDKE